MLRTPLDMSPEVLAEKSREVAASFGYTSRPADSTIRLEHRNLMIRYLNDLPGPRKWDEWLASEAPFMSIYRESLSGLDAWPLGFVTPENPAPIRPGMVSVMLDGRGQLREFRGARMTNAPDVTFDAGAVFRAMSLDQSKFTEAKADFTPNECDGYAADVERLSSRVSEYECSGRTGLVEGAVDACAAGISVHAPRKTRSEDRVPGYGNCRQTSCYLPR